MIEAIEKTPLDPAIAQMELRWKESGIPGLYDGGNGPVSRERADNVRALLYPKPKLTTGRIERYEIKSTDGTTIALRGYFPAAGESVGTVVVFHGGGWMVGSIDSHEAHAIRLANRAGVVVLSVEYRLAPEHRFPKAVEDAMAAVRWAAQNLGSLDGSNQPLAVSGDSAGGNLAAVCAVLCRDEGIALAAQLLVYPATNLAGRAGPEQLYLGDNAESVARDPRASPLLTPSLAGVAPAIIGVGAHDFLYQDNLAYAQALERAGVPIALMQWPNLNHGFCSFTAISPASEAAANALYEALGKLLRS